jgi:hypothetical protein
MAKPHFLLIVCTGRFEEKMPVKSLKLIARV